MTKRKALLNIFLILLFLLLVNLASGTKPSLPTTLYGAILDESNRRMPNIEVEAIWIDEDNNQHSTITKTLTLDEALTFGNNLYEGYYVYNQGYIAAKQGSEITIKIKGTESSQKIPANPGGAPVKVNGLIKISKPDGKTQATQSKNTDSKSAAASGQDNKPTEPTEPDKSSFKEGSSTGKPVGYSNIPGSSLDNPDNPNNSDKNVHKEPEMPVVIYGQYKDEDNQPVGGKEITLEWTDYSGAEHTASLKTLTKKEAIRLGNESLEGYFNLSGPDIVPKPDSLIKVKSDEWVKFVKPKSGDKVNIDDKNLLVQLKLLNPPPEKKEIAKEAGVYVINTTKIINNVKDTLSSRKFQNTLITLFSIAIIASFLFLIIRYKNMISLRMKSIFYNPPIKELFKYISQFDKIRIKQLFTHSDNLLDKNANLDEALNLIVSYELDSVIVMSNDRPAGIIRLRDIIEKYDFKKDTSEVRLNELMSPIPKTNLIMSSSLFDLISEFVNKRLKTIVFRNNEKLKGAITIKDVVAKLSKITSNILLDPTNLPSIKTLLNSGYAFVKKSDSLLSVRPYFIRENNDSMDDYKIVIYVLDENKKEVGMITERNFIEILYENPDLIKNQEASSIMDSIYRVNPGLSIFEALDIMDKESADILTVVSEDKIIGYITALSLLGSIRAFFIDIEKRAKSQEAKNQI